MTRTDSVAIALAGILGAGGAVARLRSMQSLSPPDLAFFHQATWSAVRGTGFTQTALEFDAGTLLGSIHLSLVRALWVPPYFLAPAPETLVALQGGLLTAGVAWAAASSGLRREATLGCVALVALHPMAIALATCDLRPLVFIVTPAVLAALGVARGKTSWTLAGVAGTLLAREEGWLVLAGMAPLVALHGRNTAGRRTGGVMLIGAVLGWSLPHLVWGHSGNITANADPAGTLEQLLSGDRAWFRWPVELKFGARALLAAWPSLWCPELLVPGLAGWLGLVVFSNMEPAAPHHGGLHYLSVVAPFILGATIIGWGRLAQRVPPRGLRWMNGLALVAALWGLPELIDVARWTLAAARPSPLVEVVEALRPASGGVLTVPRAAPLLSGREVLRIQGHFSPTPERVAEVAREVSHALLEAERPAGGPPAREWDQWQDALPAAGLELRTTVEGVQVWQR
jgi:hypothetical protein